VENRQWHRKEKQMFHVHVTENSRPYDVWMYIRHTGEYDFENLFFIFSQQGPGIPTSSYKQKLNLATPDGRWTGKTAGNLYENRLLLQKNYIFPDTGVYVFEIAQHMHENPIRNITDIGLRSVVKLWYGSFGGYFFRFPSYMLWWYGSETGLMIVVFSKALLLICQ